MPAEDYVNQLPIRRPGDGEDFRIILGPSCTDRDTGHQGYVTISLLHGRVGCVDFRPAPQEQNRDSVSPVDGGGSTAHWALMYGSGTGTTASFLRDLASSLARILLAESYEFIRKVLSKPENVKLFLALWGRYSHAQTSMGATAPLSYVGLPWNDHWKNIGSLEAELVSSLRSRIGVELQNRGISWQTNSVANTSDFLKPVIYEKPKPLFVGVVATIEAEVENTMQFCLRIKAGFRMEHDVNSHMNMAYWDDAGSWTESLDNRTSLSVSVAGSSMLSRDSALSNPSTVATSAPTLADVMSSWKTSPASRYQPRPNTFDTSSVTPAMTTGTTAGTIAGTTTDSPTRTSGDGGKKKWGCLGLKWGRGKEAPATTASQQRGGSVELSDMTAAGGNAPSVPTTGSSRGPAS